MVDGDDDDAPEDTRPFTLMNIARVIFPWTWSLAETYKLVSACSWLASPSDALLDARTGPRSQCFKPVVFNEYLGRTI